MKTRLVLGLFASILSLTATASFCGAQPGAQRGVQVLTRGPVHEAYAEPVALDPGPSVVVSQPPPEAIEELPPDERPGGDNVVWIPGYWGWDDDQNDFIWISGVWRAIPPGRDWVPGYWNQVQGGFRWVPGYWADVRSEEVTYLPEPPESIDEGPNVPAPSVEFVWVPGSWIWHHGRYAWRPGYWQRGQRDWLWVPSHYSWSPRGYVYADGYWDYDLERRGVLFAPVYVERDVYRRHGFVYSPSVVIQVGGFVANLFVRPDNCHYYFGDYYDASYRRSGFLPWHEVAHYRGGYDPIYCHERYVHRDDHDWDRRIERDYDDRRDHSDRRPPRTFAALASAHAGNANLSIAVALTQFAQHNNSGNKFQKVAENDRKSFAQKGKELVSQIGQRRQLESAPAVKQVSAQEPAAVKRTRSVIASNAKAPASLPKVEKPPQPDTKVQPAPRKRGNLAEEVRKGNLNGPAHPQPVKPIDSKEGKSQPQPVKPIDSKEGKSQPQPVKPVPSKPVPSKPEPKPEPKAQPARPEPKPAPRQEPKPAPKPEPKPEPKPAPHQDPKPAPKPEPKPEPKPAPHQDPKPAPKPEPKPAPKPEPKPAPHPEKPAQPPEKKPEHEPRDGKDPNKP